MVDSSRATLTPEEDRHLAHLVHLRAVAADVVDGQQRVGLLDDVAPVPPHASQRRLQALGVVRHLQPVLPRARLGVPRARATSSKPLKLPFGAFGRKNAVAGSSSLVQPFERASSSFASSA